MHFSALLLHSIVVRGLERGENALRRGMCGFADRRLVCKAVMFLLDSKDQPLSRRVFLSLGGNTLLAKSCGETYAKSFTWLMLKKKKVFHMTD